MPDSTPHTFGKLFDFMRGAGSKLETAMFTVLDYETRGLVQPPKGDVYGPTFDIFKQGDVGAFSLAFESRTYNAFRSMKEPIHARAGHFLVDYGAREAELPISEEAIEVMFPGKGRAGLSEFIDDMMAQGKVRSERWIGRLASTFFGSDPAAMSVVLGHNLPFDVTMTHALQGMARVNTSRVRFLDTLQLAKRMFPELGTGGGDEWRLENLRALMESTVNAEARGIRTRKAAGRTTRTPILASELYKQEAPSEFKSVFHRLNLGRLSGSHRADVDVVMSNAIVEAALERAGKSPYERIKLMRFLSESRILPGLSLGEEQQLMRHVDPQRVQDIMAMGGGREVEARRALLRDRGVATVEEAQMFGSKGLRKLEAILEGRFGTREARSFRKLADKLMTTMDQGVFILRRTAHGPTNLAFGRLGFAESFIGIPLQSFAPGESGLVFEGGKVAKARSIAYEARGGGKLGFQTYTEAFYRRLTSLLGQFQVTDRNAFKSLYNLVKKVKATPISFTAPALKAGEEPTPLKYLTREGRLQEATIGGLLQESPAHMGVPTLAAAEKIGYQAVLATPVGSQGDTASPLIAAHRDLAAAIELRNRNLGPSGKPDQLASAYRQFDEAVGRMTRAIKSIPGMAESLMFSKPEGLIGHGQAAEAMVITNPEYARVFGAITSTRGIEKRRFQYGRAADLTDEQIRYLVQERRAAIGPSVMYSPKKGFLSQRQTRQSVETAVTFYDFKGPGYARNLFGEAGVLASEEGRQLLRKQQFRGTITIKRPDRETIGHLRTLFGDRLKGLESLTSFQAGTPEEQIPLAGRGVRGKLTEAQEDALAQLQRRSGDSRNLWDVLRPGRTGPRAKLTTAKIGDELILQFQSAEMLLPRAQSMLMGPLGAARIMVTDEAKFLSARAASRSPTFLRGITAGFFAASDIFTAAAPAEMLLAHRVSLARKAGVLDDIVKYLNYDISGLSGVFRLESSGPGRLSRLVIPAQVSKEMALRYSENWKEYIKRDIRRLSTQRKTADRNLRKKLDHKIRSLAAVRSSLSGITRAPTKTERALGITSARTLFTDIAFRYDEPTDVASSLVRKSRMTIGQIMPMLRGAAGMGFEPGYHPIGEILKAELERQTGFKIGAGTLIEPSPEIKSVYRSLVGQAHIGPEATVIRPSKAEPGKFRITKLGKAAEEAGYVAGGLLRVPEPTLGVAGEGALVDRSISELKGTILDPGLTRKGLYVDLPEALTHEVPRRGVYQTKILQIPGEAFTGIGKGEFYRFGSRSIAGKLMRSLAMLSFGGMSYRGPAKGFKGVTRSTAAGITEVVVPADTLAKKMTVRERMTEVVHDLMRSASGKTGVVAKELEVEIEGVRFRPTSVPSADTPLLRALSGRPSLDDVFTVHLSQSGFDEYLAAKYGAKSAQAKMVRRRFKEKGFLYTYLWADPKQSPTHGLLLKLKIGKRMRHQAGANRGVIDALIDPYILFSLDRDLDKDVVNALMLDAMDLAPEAKYRKFQNEMGHLLDQQIKSHQEAYMKQFIGSFTDVTAEDIAASSTSSTIKSILEDIKELDVSRRSKYGIQISDELLAASLAMKVNASVGYTSSRDVERLLDVITSTKDSSTVRHVLRGLGFKMEEVPIEALTALEKVSAKEASDALNLLRFYKQAGIKKGGAGSQIQRELAISITDLMNRARRGKIEEVEFRKRMTEAFETAFVRGAEAGFESPVGYVASRLVDVSPAKTGRYLGEIMASLNFGLAGLLKAGGRGTDPLTLVSTTLDDRPDRILDALAGLDTGEPYVQQVASSADEARAAAKQMEEAAENVSLGRMLKNLKEEGPSRTRSLINQFIDSTGGKIALGAGLAIGAYALIKGMFGDDEMGTPIPPVNPVMSTTPLPPAPLIGSPQDRGPRSLPRVMNRPVARIAPTHPQPIPNYGITRTYRGVPVASSFYGGTNNVSASVTDTTDPVSRHVVDRRMRELASRDFTR